MLGRKQRSCVPTTLPTVVNLTNHTYWNLAGAVSGPVYNQTLHINANYSMSVSSIPVPTELDPGQTYSETTIFQL